MKQQDQEFAVIKNSIDTLGVLCAADSSMIIDKLTGFLWDEEEAEGIKRSGGGFRVSGMMEGE